MNKQELLSRLAAECDTWQNAISTALYIGISSESIVSEKEWLAERERLLNKPSWDDAPEVATHLAMDAGGKWAFAFNDGTNWRYADTSDEYIASVALAIPAGYDWRDSLEERTV